MIVAVVWAKGSRGLAANPRPKIPKVPPPPPPREIVYAWLGVIVMGLRLKHFWNSVTILFFGNVECSMMVQMLKNLNH